MPEPDKPVGFERNEVVVVVADDGRYNAILLQLAPEAVDKAVLARGGVVLVQPVAIVDVVNPLLFAENV
jgi:hypothetical protein